MARRYPQSWMTIEDKPRRLVAKGRSAVDPDVVVAYLVSDKSENDPLWLNDGGNKDKEVVTVIGLRKSSDGKHVRAVRVSA